MANEFRVHADGVAGALSAGVAVAATSMSSAGLADLPVIDTTNHAMLALFTLDGNGRVTKQEIVKVTAHTSGATSATIVKGQEGTSDQAWSSGDKWVHGPLPSDFVGLTNYARGCSYTYTTAPDASYPDIASSYASTDSAHTWVTQSGLFMTDGWWGTPTFGAANQRDGNCGFNAADMQATIDLGQVRDIVRVRAVGHCDTSQDIGRPVGIKVEHSDDNSTWTTDVDYSDAGAAATIRTLWHLEAAVSGAHRYWRVTVHRDTGHGFIFCSEIELLG